MGNKDYNDYRGGTAMKEIFILKVHNYIFYFDDPGFSSEQRAGLEALCLDEHRFNPKRNWGDELDVCEWFELAAKEYLGIRLERIDISFTCHFI